MSRIDRDLHNRTKPVSYGKSTDSVGDMLRAATAKSRQISVGIVGAGFAGLRCADVLLQKGFEVTIFEARNRLGGRVAQSDYLGHRVDLGPNWIHGTNDNPISRIAKESGTRIHSWAEEQALVDSDGHTLDSAEAAEYAQILWDDGLIAQAFTYSNEYTSTIDPERSLYDFFAEKAEALFSEEAADIAKRKRQKLLDFASMWGAYIGSPVTRQSLRFFWMEEVIEGENPFVAETYHKILDAVSRPAREGAEIRLNTPVKAIFSRDQKNSGNNSLPAIRTADSDTHFDEIVVTCPLGWLKRNRAAFQPSLPARLASAIDSIGYGTLDKVYITFPSAFWDTPTGTASTASSKSHGIDPEKTTPNVKSTTAPLHQDTASASQQDTTQDATHYASFIQWLSPTYADRTNPQAWNQEAINLAALPPSTAHPTLLFYTHGPCSTHLARLRQSSPSLQHFEQLLYDFFAPYIARLPEYSPSNPACTPKAILATLWANDEYAGYGSYSNFQVGLQEGDRDVETMRHGVPERGLWFAGEHCAPFVALGTTTGAWWSGEGVGRRIGEAYGMGGSVEGEERSPATR